MIAIIFTAEDQDWHYYKSNNNNFFFIHHYVILKYNICHIHLMLIVLTLV